MEYFIIHFFTKYVQLCMAVIIRIIFTNAVEELTWVDLHSCQRLGNFVCILKKISLCVSLLHIVSQLNTICNKFTRQYGGITNENSVF